MITTLILFFVLLSVLILSHECGHFFSARAFGIRVDEFGFGLPPRIKGFRRGETLYSLNWLPFGGFVKIHGEEGEDGGDSRSFANKSALKRSIVLLAGVAANFILAFLLLSLVLWLGIPESIDESEVAHFSDAQIAIVGIAPGGSADQAGIQAGDYIRSIQTNDTILVKPQKIADVQELIKSHAGKTITLRLARNGDIVEKQVFVRSNPPAGEGPTGVELSWVVTKKVLWYQAPIEGARFTYTITGATLHGLWDMIKSLFHRQGPGVEVAGPVGIFKLVGSVRHSGLAPFLMFAAVLSINLALINVLPIPGLDGGRFAFIVAEAIRGKRISARTSAITHGIGFIVLLGLMLLITLLDLAKVF